MGDSYRIRTEIGINKTINLQLDQDFEFLEILSLKIQQTDIYSRDCANYGVVVGRVTANNGFGVPNARVSVFIPIDEVDLSNPIISSIYPYKSPTDKNEDGYRYNLLPYEASYSKHAATGTLPTRTDVLTGATAVEIYDKYYKYTVKTNESGDYMIMGVPLGSHDFVMDVDLSDIGEFSLTPQDLIRMGVATESQVAGDRFRSSNDLNSLPQIINLTKQIEISPLWGDPELCQIAVNRLDFDLRNEANIDIQPTAIFMGSIISTEDKYRVRWKGKPRDNMGNLCRLSTGPGQILAIRQTLRQDEDGNPILEQYQLEQSGNIIDSDGVWLTEVPMNLEYVTTNEFGQRIISNDPAIGIATKGKYRFKIKWTQPPNLSSEVRRPYYLVPNVREYGWDLGVDPTLLSTGTTQYQQALSSYYFGLNWSGYTDGFSGQRKIDKLNDAIDCEDTFYEFKFNKVYTVANFIDEYKSGGGRGKFIGIKEIDDDNCESTVNKFPVNEGFRNFDLLFFLFSILFTSLQYTALTVLIQAHIYLGIISLIINFICLLCRIKIFGIRPFAFICNILRINCNTKRFTIRLPMMTYPLCETCKCKDTTVTDQSVLAGANGVLSYVSFPSSYYNNLQVYLSSSTPQEDVEYRSLIFSEAMGGNSDDVNNLFKIPKSGVLRYQSDSSDGRRYFAWSDGLPLGERVNIFNSRISYFQGVNRIKVSFNSPQNLGTFHYDNTITVLSNQIFTSGELLTTVDPATSSDSNFLFTASTVTGVTYGITGSSISGPQIINVKYANTTNQLTEQSVSYILNTGSTVDKQAYPMDREYFQVVTAITVADAAKIWNTGTTQSFPNVLTSGHKVVEMRHRATFGYERESTQYLSPYELFDNIGTQYILILQRGVDPYSPKFTNEYGLGKMFGLNESDITITASTRLNIPIQKLNNSNLSVQQLTQSDSFYQSYFFTPGSQFVPFTSSTIGYYGRNDATTPIGGSTTINQYGTTSRITLSSNDFYYSQEDSDKYSQSEDISGGAFFYLNLTTGLSFGYRDVDTVYTSPVLYPTLTASPITISVKTNNVFRNDRLPSSDQLNGPSWDSNSVALLQQNNNFTFYAIPDSGLDAVVEGYTTGASQVNPDIEDLPAAPNVLNSFSCENMVALNCYQGFGKNFGINTGCTETDAVERGCYMLLRRPLLDLVKDIKNYSEWAFRFRYFYALCRGVLSQTFTNNWVNGVLYMYPIQVLTFYDKQNRPEPPKYAKSITVFDAKTTNFYFRSSPYRDSNDTFIGRPTTGQVDPINLRQLLFPTTIINLGMKDNFYQEIIFDADAKAYLMNALNPTSYSDASDLINFFVITRITSATVLGRILGLLGLGDNAINQLFSRPERRVDGDLAQAMSINSEFGVLPFSSEYYEVTGQGNDPAEILGTPRYPTMGVYFSSTTEDLQYKDFISPGVINFRPANNLNALPYFYGIKSQRVPFYQWGLNPNGTIFGNQDNNWRTGSLNGIISYNYQSMSRRFTNSPSYFSGTYNNVSDIYQRGYIFAVDQNQNYSASSGRWTTNFAVGAPYHFYFGLMKGKTALDKFKTKYSIDE